MPTLSVHDAAILKTAQQNKLGELAPVSKLQSDQVAFKAAFVLQNRAIVIDRPDLPKLDGLYTYGAGPCAVLTVVEKDQQGIRKIGMAHIDALTSEKSITQFLSKFDRHSDVSIVSGEQDTFLRLSHALTKRGMHPKFINADLDGTRVDAAVLSTKGDLYYGRLSQSMSLPDIAALSEFIVSKGKAPFSIESYSEWLHRQHSTPELLKSSHHSHAVPHINPWVKDAVPAVSVDTHNTASPFLLAQTLVQQSQLLQQSQPFQRSVSEVLAEVVNQQSLAATSSPKVI